MSGYDRSLYQTYLASVPMFRSCTEVQLDHLAALAEAITVQDHPIVSEGDAGNEFYVITSGKARVSRGGKDVVDLGQGDYFGELSLFDPAPRNATVSAVGPVTLVALSRDAFTKALNEMPPIRDALLHGMAHRLHELDARA